MPKKRNRYWKQKELPPVYVPLSDVKWPVVCEDTGEVCETYREYLRSKHWAKVKRAYRKHKGAPNLCANCDTYRGLELHHITYVNIGHEAMDDLMWLCWHCHQAMHNRRPTRRRYA